MSPAPADRHDGGGCRYPLSTPRRRREGEGGTVSRVLFGPPKRPGWSSLWDDCHQSPRAAYPRLTPEGGGGAGRTSPLIWPCSDWGLPCHRRYRRRGGLLPHHFTLTAGSRRRRCVFCGPVRRLSAPRRYLAVYPLELGLSSNRPEGRSATIPSYPGVKGNGINWLRGFLPPRPGAGAPAARPAGVLDPPRTTGRRRPGIPPRPRCPARASRGLGLGVTGPGEG